MPLNIAMGRNARLRKLRREARRQFHRDPSLEATANDYERRHPDSILLCGNAQEKMSEVLEDFAEPLLREAKTPEDTKKALLIAMVAWNYSLLDDAARQDPNAPHAAMMADPIVRDMFNSLAARKQALYPNNRRIILDFQLIPNGSEYRFNVVSTMDSRSRLLG
jgi:hypothetical protein